MESMLSSMRSSSFFGSAVEVETGFSVAVVISYLPLLDFRDTAFASQHPFAQPSLAS
jgi:hypothetical protein